MTSIKVAIKVRPLIQREKDENLRSQWSVVDEDTIKSNNKLHTLTFDKVFDETRSTEELFQEVALPIVTNAIKGINGTIFAYGQTSSGKTYCMMGTEDNPGIVPLAIDELFRQIESCEEREFLLRIGYIEIYNERIFDLLVNGKPEITKIREVSGEVYIHHQELILSSVSSILSSYAQGNALRRIGETSMNDLSSRSHSIFRIIIESKALNCNDEAVHVSTLNLVDLAGSERADQTKATGERLREGGHINKSLLALSKVIRELSENSGENSDKLQHVPYRDSKLTRILSASLGGNAQTAIICTVTPAVLDETLSTLTFASNAKKIKNRPTVNEVVSDQMIMNRMRKEISELRAELAKATNPAEGLIGKIHRLEEHFIHYHRPYHNHEKEKNRRRTWNCPSMENSMIPKFTFNNVPKVEQPPPFIKRSVCSPINEDDNEIFISPSKINLDQQLSPMKGARNTEDLKNMIHTPRSLMPMKFNDIDKSPAIGTAMDPYKRIAVLEQELDELNMFKLVEDHTSKPKQEDIVKLQHKLEEADMLMNQKEAQIVELKAIIEKLKGYDDIHRLNEMEHKKVVHELQVAKDKNCELEIRNEKAKNRETELISCLQEARDESKVNELTDQIKGLQEKLRKTEEDLFMLQSKSESQKQSCDDNKVYIDRIKVLESEVQKMADLQKEHTTLSDQLLDSLQDAESLQQKLTKLEEEFNSKQTLFEENEKKLNEENKILNIQLAELTEKTLSFKKIQEMLINGNVEEIEEDDVFGKIIVDLHRNSSKTETLETEKLQLAKDLEDIRATVGHLSEQLVVSQSAAEGEQQSKMEVLCLSEELIKTKCLLEESLKKCSEFDEMKRKFEEASSGNCDALIDDLKQQIERLTRENSHMAATLKECEGFETEVESLTNEKIKMQATIEELISKIPIKEEAHDKSVEDIFADSFNNERVSDVKPCLPAQIEALKQEINEFKSTVETDRLQIESLKTEKSNFNAQLEEKINFIADLTKQIEETNDLQNEILTKDERIAQLEGQIEELKSIPHAQTDDVNLKLSEELQMIKNDYESHKVMHNETMAEYNSLLEQVDQLKQSFEKLQEEKNSLEQEKVKFDQLLLENEHLKASLGEFQASHSECEKYETEEKDGTIAELEGKIQSLEELLQKTAQNSTDDDKTKLEGELLELKTQNQSLIDQYSTAKAISDELKFQLEGMKKEETATKTLLDDKLAEIFSLQDQLSATQTKLNEKTAEMTSLEEKLSEKCAEMTSLEDKLSEKCAEVTSLEAKLSDLSNELSCANSQLSDSTLKVQELNDLINGLKQQLNENHVPSDYEEKINEVNDLKKQIETLMAENSEITKLKDVISEMSSNNETLLKDKQETDSENEKLKSNIQKFEDQTNELNDKIFKLTAEITNRDSLLIIKDEKFARLETDFEEAKTRLRRRSVDTRSKTDALEAKLNDKMIKLGEIEALKASKESELKRTKEDLSKVSQERDKLKMANDENDMKYAVLDEKYSQLSDQYKRDVDSLNVQLSQQTSENFTHSRIVAELREKCEILEQQVQDKKKLSVSPRLRRSSEHEVDENAYSLQHKLLVTESNTGTPVRTQRSNFERKTRRQSVYDDNRRLSIWEKYQSVETQTDASNEMCACCDLREKLKKMTMEVKIRDCKIANFERLAEANPLKVDLQQAHTDLEKERRSHAKTKYFLNEANEKLAGLSKNQKSRVDHVTRGLQTSMSMSNYMEKTAFYEIQNEKFALEKQLNECERQIRKLEEEKKAGEELKKVVEKENIRHNSQNSNSDEMTVSQKLYDDLARKYDMAKRLCSLRNDTIEKLTKENTSMKQLEDYCQQLQEKMTEDVTKVSKDYLQMKSKYENAKEICDLRKKKILEMRAKYEPDATATLNDVN